MDITSRPRHRRRRVRALGLILLAALAIGCSSSSSNGGGSNEPRRGKNKGKGSGCDDLIPIRSTKTPDGIAAEGRWLREHYGEYRKKSQNLIFCDDGQTADLVEIELPDGRVVTVFFDISRFFGKY